MMTLLLIAILSIAPAFLITSVIVDKYGGVELEVNCGEYVEDEPTLGVTTRNIKNGDTDERVYARILTKDDEDNHHWSEWKKLQHSGCDDRVKGKTDFYDDFADITDEWEALALYNCGEDGWALDSVTYWNGTGSNHEIAMFCDNIAGPSVDCYRDEVDDPDAVCYPGYEDRLFDYVWIDQDNSGCPGITLDLQNAKGRDLYVGKVFAKSNPGIPDCEVNNAISSDPQLPTDQYPYNYNDYNAPSPDMNPYTLDIAGGVIICLLLVNILCFGYKNCCNRTSNRNKYAKVNVIASSDDEAQHLNHV